MIRTVIKTVLANKLRLILTALSIVMGVAFIAGTFIFTDTIDRTFEDLFEDALAGQDVIVQTDTEFNPGFAGPPPFEENVLDIVRNVPGVEAAEGQVGGFALIYDKEGEAIVPFGPPTLGGSWTADERLWGNIAVRDGRPPTGPGEVSVDARTAEDHGFAVGDMIRIQTADGVAEYELVAIIGFGEADNLAGATFAGFELASAQQLFGRVGQFDNIAAVASEGVSAAELRNRIAAALPAGLEAVTVADQAAEQTEALQEGLSFIRTGLLVFAVVAVFVASFIIQNTFRIIVRQRQRELALFRAVGATGNQIVAMVVSEALIVAVVASALGVLFGLVISQALTAMMSGIGWDIPSTTAPLELRTIVIGMATGVVVTVLAALLPAIRASRIPPVAALQDVDVQLRMPDRVRTIVGVVLLVGGVGFILAGLFGDVIDLGPINELSAAGIGALIVFLAVSLLSSLFVKPLAGVLGWPMPKVDKMTGTLAVENSVRKPRRTATTAAALMIGLALVAFFFIFGDSIKASAGAAIEEGLRADYVLSVSGFAGGFSPNLGDALEASPEVETVTRFRLGIWDRQGTDELLMGVDTETIDETVFLDVQQGSLAALGAGGVFVHEDVANDEGWALGDTIPMGFNATGLQNVEIVGIYGEQNVVQSSFLAGLDFYRQNFAGFGTDLDFVLAVNAAAGTSADAARVAVEAAAADFPNVSVQDQAEYRKSQEEQVNTLLLLFNGLLILAVIIAMFGITNTLALSVFERTREIGLLRAVGMSRWQVRRMVLWESIIVAVIGAVLGIVVGLFFGVVVTRALAAQGIDVLSVPAAQIVGLVIFGAIVGLFAAIFPARKAARLNILEAIGYE